MQVYADGYSPREIDFMVVEQHPTLLNVTLFPAKVSRRPWQHVWSGGGKAPPVVEEGIFGTGERGDRILLQNKASVINFTPLLTACAIMIGIA